MNRPARITALTLAAVLFGATLFAADAKLAQTADRVVPLAMKTFEVPGIAVGVVHDGRLVFARGYGVRKVGESRAIDPQTLFQVASNTKAFTAAALAILVDEGKIAWDDRVIDHLPAFALSDPYITRELTVRDLLVHRSGLGLGAGDLLWWPPTTYTSEEIVRRLRHVPVASSFRSRYAYDNVLYLVAGEVIEEVSGQPWEAFVRERIFLPLGMTGSFTSAEGLRKAVNGATPHARSDFHGPVQPVEIASMDNTGPAGAIVTNVEDLSKWVAMQLTRGAIPGSEGRLFSEEQSKEMHAPHTIMRIGETPEYLAPARRNFATYGLGWVVTDYRGRKMVYHTGGLPGFLTRVTLVPELGLGVIVLTNQESSEAYNAITHALVDAAGGEKPFDWVEGYRRQREEKIAKAKEREEKAEKGRNTASKPSLPLEAYAGTYRDAWYGDITITPAGEGLAISFTRTPRLTGMLEHWQYDTFVARWNDRTLNGDAFLTFALDPDGAIETAKMKPISPLVDFSFDYHDLSLTRVEEEKQNE